MDEVKRKQVHKVILNDREELTINGILDVISFDEEIILVETSLGVLEVKGENLHVNQLNLDSGDLNLTGQILSIEYDDHNRFAKNKESFLAKLFS